MLTVIGKCLGTIAVERGQGANAFTQNVVGVSVVGDDPFGTPTVTQIVIGDKVFNDKLRAEIDKCKGQEVQIAVGQVLKVFRNNPQSTLYFNNLLPAPNYLKS